MKNWKPRKWLTLTLTCYTIWHFSEKDLCPIWVIAVFYGSDSGCRHTIIYICNFVCWSSWSMDVCCRDVWWGGRGSRGREGGVTGGSRLANKEHLQMSPSCSDTSCIYSTLSNDLLDISHIYIFSHIYPLHLKINDDIIY